MLAAQLGVGDAGASTGYLFSTITAVVVGGTLLTGGRGGVLQSLVGVLIVTVLNNGMIELGISPSWLTGIQGTLIVLAVVASNWPLREKLRIVK
jgi:ribose transport system permease protein